MTTVPSGAARCSADAGHVLIAAVLWIQLIGLVLAVDPAVASTPDGGVIRAAKSADGEIGPEALTLAMKNQKQGAMQCWAGSPDSWGFTVRFSVTPLGVVVRPEVELRGSTEDPKLKGCLLDWLKTLKFPATKRGAHDVVSPFFT